ncbi:replication initiation protein [Fictibacillus sp. KIGAM418]|uniref:Replication initiation protein n=1 Tax=Fictibacillus marinisediminis TaxID=2878389 RepID=A0A9X1XEH7_9BACL|nr:replication initiation protein [Fictibacillus marinisediminis]MCK6259427.1 replication initiation protein [Fictibacillus marinisediminis]
MIHIKELDPPRGDHLSFYKVQETDHLNAYHWVTKSNALIEKKYQLSVLEQKLILCLSSLVQPSDEAFRPYRIKVSDFVQLLGLKSTGKYTEIRKIVKALQLKTLPLYTDQSILDITWLSSAEYFHGKGYVELEFSPKLKPYLLQLKEKFTTYQLKNIIQLRSAYSIRIYELLKQYEHIGQRTFLLDELREVIGISPTKYKLFGHFKDKILNVSKKELEEKTDLCFEFAETKTGKKVTEIKFLIFKNTNKQRALSVSKDPDPKVQLKVILENTGIKTSVAKSLINDFPLEQIERNIRYSQSVFTKKKTDNPVGYLIQSIREDYAHSVTRHSESKLPEYLRTTEDLNVSGDTLPREPEYNASIIEEHLLQIKQLLYNIMEFSHQDEEVVLQRYKNEVLQYLSAMMDKRKQQNLPLLDSSEFKDQEIRTYYSSLFPVTS